MRPYARDSAVAIIFRNGPHALVDIVPNLLKLGREYLNVSIVHELLEQVRHHRREHLEDVINIAILLAVLFVALNERLELVGRELVHHEFDAELAIQGRVKLTGSVRVSKDLVRVDREPVHGVVDERSNKLPIR